MNRSENRILTTHTGSLHMPRDLAALVYTEWRGEAADAAAVDERLAEAVVEVVQRQVALGVDIVSDGEFSKSNWMGYVADRMSGVELRPMAEFYSGEGAAHGSRDSALFPGFYAEAGDQMVYLEPGAERESFEWSWSHQPVAVDKLAYTARGHEKLQRDIDNLKAAVGDREAFLPVVAPGSIFPWIRNEHYPDDESLFADLAAALHEEYRAIIDAGLICQVDDASLVGEWNERLTGRDWDTDSYRRWATLSVDALNAALDGLPEDRIRYHVCWGSSNRPHVSDIPLPEVVDLILRVDAQAYVLEAANARHEWEVAVWDDVKLPDGKILVPGVIEHATHVVEHPRTVAARIVRFAERVGRENVIAGTDCGLRHRAHPEVAWAKLRALSEGAAIASDVLWGRG